MTLKYKNESILSASEKIIAHGCNLKGKMGKGVALAIKERWPKAFTTYEYAIISGGMSLGSVNWAEINETRVIANVITQSTVGKEPHIRYASYDAIDKGLRALVTEGREKHYISEGDAIAMPIIGAGLGNAKWHIVKAIIEQVSEDLKIDFTIYETNKERFENVTAALDRAEAVS